MAESTGQDRTEAPTPERLRKAREEGNIPQSQETCTAVMMLALLAAVALGGQAFLSWSAAQMRQAFSWAGAPAGTTPLGAMLHAKAIDCLLVLLPFLAVTAVASVAGSLVASGWSVGPKAVRLNFGRLSPGRGLKELFSLRSTVQIITSVAKLVVLWLLVWAYLRDRLGTCLALRWGAPGELLTQIASLAMGVLARLTIGLCVIAALELLYQRYSYKRRLRMTKQEVKEERRQHELAPELRGRIRSIQFSLARKRMLQDVPKADVVIVNPTHVAVALQYNAADMDAPVVLAKGADLLCEKIKEIARENHIAVVERPELARTLFATVEVGQAIPEMLFVAVAEVLAMVYRLRRKSAGMAF